MLFRNPDGFGPRSWEYIKIKLPWLTRGGDEWHPFSIYLRESTQIGFNSVHNIQTSMSIGPETKNGIAQDTSLEEFVRTVLLSDFEDEAIDAPRSLFVQEARSDHSNIYHTTQMFISPVGDWTRGLVHDIRKQKQLRACWVRGPCTSPFFVAREFSHLVLTASGIGITPVLGVMNQYPGYSRTKILVWLTRDANMLKFFALLIKDAHLAVVFYTGMEKLTDKEMSTISAHGNIYLQQSRPDCLTEAIGSIIIQFENFLNLSDAQTVKEID